MKRGFLNKPNKVSGRRETKEIVHVPTKTHDPKKSVLDLVQIPIITRLPSNSPAKPNVPQPLAYNLVTLPRSAKNGPTVMCIIFPDTKEKLLALPDFPAPVPPHSIYFNFNILRYVFKSTPGMGRGMFAVRQFNPGDVIVCERPLLLIPVMMPCVQSTQPDQLFKIAVESLPPPIREIFYSLHNCKGSDVSKLRGIIDTNCLDIGNLPGTYNGLYGAVCGEMSYINHSCIPNAEHVWDLASMTFTVRALYPIPPGEQVYITYTDLCQTRAERQEELFSKYSFKCACPSCCLPSAESKRSDVRRLLLQTLTNRKLTDQVVRDQDRAGREWALDFSRPDDELIKRSQQVLDLMEEEGIYDQDAWFAHCAWLCKARSALGDREAVVKLAKQAATMATIYTGNNRGWKKVADAPENTEWWGLRKKATK